MIAKTVLTLALFNVQIMFTQQLDGKFIGQSDPFQENKEVFQFDGKGDFSHTFPGVHGDGHFGNGSYQIEKNLLLLYYNKTQLNNFSGYFRHRSWVNNKDSVTLKIRVLDVHQKPMHGANAIILFKQLGTAMDKEGAGKLVLRKSDSIYDIEISHIGYETLKMPLQGNLNYEIVANLQQNSLGVPLLDQIDTLRIAKKSKQTIIVIDKNGKQLTKAD